MRFHFHKDTQTFQTCIWLMFFKCLNGLKRLPLCHFRGCHIPLELHFGLCFCYLWKHYFSNLAKSIVRKIPYHSMHEGRERKLPHNYFSRWPNAPGKMLQGLKGYGGLYWEKSQSTILNWSLNDAFQNLILHEQVMKKINIYTYIQT